MVSPLFSLPFSIIWYLHNMYLNPTWDTHPQFGDHPFSQSNNSGSAPDQWFWFNPMPTNTMNTYIIVSYPNDSNLAILNFNNPKSYPPPRVKPNNIKVQDIAHTRLSHRPFTFYHWLILTKIVLNLNQVNMFSSQKSNSQGDINLCGYLSIWMGLFSNLYHRWYDLTSE